MRDPQHAGGPRRGRWSTAGRAGRSFRSMAAAAAVVLTVAGCSLEDPGLPDDLRDPSAHEMPSVRPELERFHTQTLDWSRCDGGECASLEVPVDYEKPDGPTMELALLRVKAKDQDKKVGSLVLNPGGPGSSGIDYAQAASAVVGPKVRQVYDVVGFDPRGVARSEPVDCVDDRGLDAFLGLDTSPDDAAEKKAAEQALTGFVEGCQSKQGDRLAQITTANSARDMDVLRGALGDARLNYLGLSYGTMLGATYAHAFPERVGAFVLDGMLPTDLDALDIGLGQARGFERATESYLQWCTQQRDCPLGESVEEAREGLRQLMQDVDANPPAVEPDLHVKDLTIGWATYGLAAAMYSQDSWPALNNAIKQAQQGNGEGLMQLANGYAERTADGGYRSNLMEAFHTYTCNDRVEDTKGRSEQEVRAAFRKEAPLWGDFLLGEGSVCEGWPVDAAQPFDATAPGSGPILVIGTTRDPATPMEWAERAAEDFENGHLLTLDGDGHTAYKRGSSCIDSAVDSYLLTGTVPQGDAARCD